MELKHHNLAVYILLVGLTVSAVFGCIYYAQNMLVMENGHSANMAECCDIGLLLSDATHNIPLILTGGLQLLSLSLLLVLYIFVKRWFTTSRYDLNDYFKVRERYGGFNLFNYLIPIFSKGIIHPKIY